MWAEVELQPSSQELEADTCHPGVSWQSTEPAGAPPPHLSSRELLELPKSLHPGGKTWLDLKYSFWVLVAAFKDQASCQGSWGVLLHLRGWLMSLVPFDGASLQANPHGGKPQGAGDLSNHTCPCRALARSGKGEPVKVRFSFALCLHAGEKQRGLAAKASTWWLRDEGWRMEEIRNQEYPFRKALLSLAFS